MTRRDSVCLGQLRASLRDQQLSSAEKSESGPPPAGLIPAPEQLREVASLPGEEGAQRVAGRAGASLGLSRPHAPLPTPPAGDGAQGA